jgi:hypothetical protein
LLLLENILSNLKIEGSVNGLMSLVNKDMFGEFYHLNRDVRVHPIQVSQEERMFTEIIHI